MIVDANVLLYAADASSPQHHQASSWLTDALNGTGRVGLPWQSIFAFIRISTHPRISESPLSGDQAWDIASEWLAVDVVWTPEPGPSYPAIVARLMHDTRATGNLITDLQLAALAIEHGLPVCSADTDFSRFPGLTWFNPLTG